MAQNREKFFKPEDFDKKNLQIKSHSRKNALRILAFLAVLVGIYGIYTLIDNGRKTSDPAEEIVAMVTNRGGEKRDSEIKLFKEKETNVKQEGSKPNVKQPTAKEDEEPQTISASATSQNVKKQVPLPGTLEEKAKRVIRGDFGNGQVRKDKLGDEYAEIQSKVNEMYRKGDIYM